jgi:hypothetical protein
MTTASPAAPLARLKIIYGPRWHITASIPGTGPRTLTATETGTGRRIRARNESELETRLRQLRVADAAGADHPGGPATRGR